MLVLTLFFLGFKLAKDKPKRRLDIYSREFTISKSQPKYEGENIEYVTVDKDGSATIKTLLSGETIKAKEDEFFKGKDYGLYGLQLISSSYEEQIIRLKRYLSDDIDDE